VSYFYIKISSKSQIDFLYDIPNCFSASPSFVLSKIFVLVLKLYMCEIPCLKDFDERGASVTWKIWNVFHRNCEILSRHFRFHFLLKKLFKVLSVSDLRSLWNLYASLQFVEISSLFRCWGKPGVNKKATYHCPCSAFSCITVNNYYIWDIFFEKSIHAFASSKQNLNAGRVMVFPIVMLDLFSKSFIFITSPTHVVDFKVPIMFSI